MREKILVPCLDVMELIQYGRRIGKKVYCARMQTMASQFYTLIKHAFSTNRSARCITTLL